MNIRSFLCLTLAPLLCGAIASAADAERPAKPNIILILTDDLGWQDVKCYDIDEPSQMETPNLDALAQKGVQFWQAYSPAPTCAPSRAAILSGAHPARAQMTHVFGGKPPRPHHRTGWPMMAPWYSVSMPADVVTIAEALRPYGYTTGHSGKWHIAMRHHGYPQPADQGFDYTRNSRGVQCRMKPDRLTGFATEAANDPYRLDANGFPFDQTHHDAMAFLRENHTEPFFLYYATWLVHTPIVMRSEGLLRKYEAKLGVTLTEAHKKNWKLEGQTNPFYCAMVEQLDYYMGNLFEYLETTDDPRWPGHKLVENTYIIFTSDNGGMESSGPNQIITDNYPLDRGKISAMEGGVRVPLIITGPGIHSGVQSDVMVNGLDFYPTILSLTGAPVPAAKQFDGCDLSTLLTADPTDASLVRDARGRVRDTMVWHFPNAGAMESTIRIGDYKLVRNYQHLPADVAPLELYRLYDSNSGEPVRVDIEEANNLADALPEKTQALNAQLTEVLTEMKASYPYWNPNSKLRLSNQDRVGSVVSCQREGDQVMVRYRENGAEVVRVNLIYTTNGGDYFEEWFRAPATLQADNTAVVRLPQGTTHYFVNLIDENNFLVSYPEIDATKLNKAKQTYADVGLSVN